MRQVIKAYGDIPCPCLPPGDAGNPREASTEAWRIWILDCHKQLDLLKDTRRKLRKKHRAMDLQKAHNIFQTLFNTNQAKANKKINQQGAQSSGLLALKDKTGQVVTSLEGRLRVVHAFYHNLATVPRDRPAASMPWSLQLDQISIATNATMGARQISVLTMLQDVNRFARLVRGLSENKAPGLDEVPNEILKWLPDGVLAEFHATFEEVYSASYTPDFMKVSKSVLISKNKGGLEELQNYRPITLANTLTKLYTGILASCMQDYCEALDILTDSQEGMVPFPLLLGVERAMRHHAAAPNHRQHAFRRQAPEQGHICAVCGFSLGLQHHIP